MRLPVALAAATLLVLAPLSASAYVQTMTCDASGVGKYACRAGETPRPVHWPTRCVHYYINEDGTSDISDVSRTYAAIQASFTAWDEVQGGEFVMEYAGLTNESRAEHDDERGPGGNANVIMFRDDDWPYASRTAFAITSVTFDPVNGEIADADTEINSQFHRFTAGDQLVLVDLRNTMTHEAGHFLGLEHSPVKDATMYSSAPEGETQKRTLHLDDIEGYFATYPAKGKTPECDDIPDYFFAPDVKEKKGCCATAARPSPPSAVLLAAALVVGLRRRRRRDP